MRDERAQRREQTGKVRMEAAQGDASGRKVIEAKDVSVSFGGHEVLRDVSTTIMRGDRIGLIGPNGSGKTTLLKALLGELVPDSGEVRLGSNLQVAYFDQYRATLREDWNAIENVAEGREYVEVGGRQKHVIGYLQDFLFTPERARAPITRLSGGERNRLLLARLFAQPSNLLVMDEPTNDLDVETLELLEDLLGEYAGTLLLVSHDRDFLDNVVTSTLVMEGDGSVGDYVGGYTDWLRQRTVDASSRTPAREPAKPDQPAAPAPLAAKRKLSFKESRELESLPALIETLEAEVESLTAALSDPAFYSRDASVITAHNAKIADAQARLDAAYSRWSELDA
jgi:ATP-binding cassette subfamily F protein uup